MIIAITGGFNIKNLIEFLNLNRNAVRINKQENPTLNGSTRKIKNTQAKINFNILSVLIKYLRNSVKIKTKNKSLKRKKEKNISS